jgi:hypothetical protein
MHCTQPVTGIQWLYSVELLSLSPQYVTAAWRHVPHPPLRYTALDASCYWRTNCLRHTHRALETFCTSRRRSLFTFPNTSQSELQKALSDTKLNLQFIHTRKHIQSFIDVSRLTLYTTTQGKKFESEVYGTVLLRIKSFRMRHIPTDIQGGEGGTTGWNKQCTLRVFFLQ